MLLGMASMASALPLAENFAALTTDLVTKTPGQPGTYFWISKANSTIFGDDASLYDYYLHSDAAAAQEAVQAYAEAIVAHAKDSEVLNFFLNATLAGTLSFDQATNETWKCLEVSDTIKSAIPDCQTVSAVDRKETSRKTEEEHSVSRRSLYKWILSTAHKSSSFAMNTLASVLGNAVYSNLPTSPRSFCNTASDGTNACFSWSSLEPSFTER